MFGISPGKTPVPVDCLQFHQNFSYVNPAYDLIIKDDIVVDDHQTIEVVGRSVVVAEGINLRAKEITVIFTNPTRKLVCLGSFICDKLTTNALETTTRKWDYITTAFNYRTLGPRETTDYARGRSFQNYFPSPGTVVEWDFKED